MKRLAVKVAVICSLVGIALLGFATQVMAQWVETLPTRVQDRILWSADHEEGSLFDWHYASGDGGGGVFNTGGSDVSAGAASSVAHSGRFSARAQITNAHRAQNGSRAVRLMRWTDKAWFDGGDYFPRKAFYSTWMYFPRTFNPNKYPPWDPGDGGWWNVFQFKSEGKRGESKPMWGLNVYHDDERREMSFYLHSQRNRPASYEQRRPVPIPVGEWVHVEALYKASHKKRKGRIAIWQDGRRILNARRVRTVLRGGSRRPVWGVGNYTDHISGGARVGEATIFFDDAVVSRARILSEK